MCLHGPRCAATTGNIKVAFCQSFSVRSHKGHTSYRASMCAVLGAAQWPTAGTVCSGMSPPRLQLISVLQLHLLTAHAHNSVNHRVRWLAADAQYCPCCTSAWLFLVPSERCLRGSAGAPRQLEILKWPFAGVSRCRCTSSWQRAPCCTALLALPMRVALPCWPGRVS